MVEYRKARQNEERDILDFINMVFSQLHVPHDFCRLLSKVYAHPGFYKLHYVGAEEDGHIKSTVALLPMELLPDEESSLKLGYIGSVSVHGYSRSEGHMKGTMQAMLSDAKNNGYDLLALGGQRQRYNYFGFERGGATVHFEINASNVRHALKNIYTEGFSLYELKEDDDVLLDQVYEMGQKKAFRCKWDRSRLWNILHSWYGAPYALKEENGEMLGYLYAIGDTVAEFTLKEVDLLPVLLKLWMENRKECEVLVPLFDTVSMNILNSIAESYQVTDNDMYQILNWKHVLETLFRLKSKQQSLANGKFLFCIENSGFFKMEVKDGIATLETDPKELAEDEETALLLTEEEAIRFFFSPYTALTRTNPMLKSWLPLPLYLSQSDTF